MGAGSDAKFPPTCERGRWCEIRPNWAIDQAYPPPASSPARGEDCRRTYHGYSLSSSQEGCYEADGWVRDAAAFSPLSLARKWGMTYFPKRRKEFITSAWVAGPAWKIGMISVAPICS
jgi:hypothetical protein